MSDVKGEPLPATVTFRLGVLGAMAGDRFAEAVKPYGIKPKHAGVMAILGDEQAASQQELATRMGVAPSLMVSLVDRLEALDAVRRVRDPKDRRRQVLTLTAEGRELLERCARAARALDEELLAALTVAQRAALGRALEALAGAAGLPADGA
ncbi:MarR family transcriptional regulator [Streptomyces sp. NPDC050738]|uniref:MarR family winged helix-turn-helix transcriptional regulator n=1 Tax=Streptomyces sp. NPDC050738 TaxID=3154744 RepID=UPI00343D4FDD